MNLSYLARGLTFLGFLFLIADEIGVFGEKSLDREWIKGAIAGASLVYLLYQLPP